MKSQGLGTRGQVLGVQSRGPTPGHLKLSRYFLLISSRTQREKYPAVFFYPSYSQLTTNDGIELTRKLFHCIIIVLL